MTTMMVGGAGAFGGGGLGVGRRGLSPPSGTSSHNQRHSSPQPPLSPASSDSPTSPVSPGRHGNKACGVCGDVAKSMHFGGLSCDSCKAFFRRSVQNNAYKGFTCPYEKKCVIAVSSRKACQYCRFHKCLNIGMEKGWVMSEDERRKMMQQRQEKKLKADQKKHHETKDIDKYSLSEEDNTEIQIIVSLYRKAYQDVPYDTSCQNDGAAGVMSPWMTFCKRIGYFFSLFREFTELPSGDQATLMKTAITSACIIMGSVVYDSSTGKWPGKPITRSGFVPNVSSQNVKQLVPSDLMSRVEQFFRKFQQICPDETMAMILILVTLYSSELIGLEAKETIQALQDRYTRILHHYVAWKYKEKSHMMFPKVLVSLADIRELSERTCQMRIQQGFSSSSQNITSLLPKSNPQDSSSATPMDTSQSEEAALDSTDSGMVNVKEEFDIDCNSALNTPAAHKRARLEATGSARDHTYQKILQKVMDQMHSSLHLRAPQLLPIVIHIVKKIKAEGGGVDDSSHTTKTHHVKQPRGGTKRRQVEVKQEQIEEDCNAQFSQDLPNSDLNDPMSPDIHHTPHFNLSQQLQQDLHPPQTEVLHQQQYMPPSADINLGYPASPMDSTDSFDMLPTSPLHCQNSVMSPNLMLSANHSADVRLSPQVPLMAPVAPYTPPSVVTSSPMPVQQSEVFPVADMPLPSPMAAPSPYSDTSSSSPPESSQSPLSELFTEELSDVEIDVLTQLMDYVCNSNLENVSSIKEIIPEHLLTELQTKLCTYSLKQE
ncbi:retinoic acid receptor beta-like [Penaeus indicus]|uniref:retinoic acid receptor beta-like n=1 Tax=Penaeus indicus TaxID=29960 RepID=UPI00300DB1A9